jgi:hypothetical protein
MINFQEILIISDQPTTCPKCGSRTEITLDLSHINNHVQVHQCLNYLCKNQFVVESDKELIV